MLTPKRKRIVLLTLLVIILFINWQVYLQFYHTLQDFWIGLFQNITPYLPDFITNRPTLTQEVMPKGISYLLLMLVNIGISISIIHVYFQDKKITRQGFQIIGIYFLCGFSAMIFCYAMGWKEYYTSARWALNLLSSPLVECSMIPILQLANHPEMQKEV